MRKRKAINLLTNEGWKLRQELGEKKLDITMFSVRPRYNETSHSEEKLISLEIRYIKV